MPVATNQQMLEKWNEMPEENRRQTVTAFHIAVVEGALDKNAPPREALDQLRASGKNLSDYVMFLVHRDERTVATKFKMSFGPKQQYGVTIIPRKLVSTSKIPKQYRARFEYAKEATVENPTPGRLHAVVVASGNATVHVADVEQDEAILTRKKAAAEELVASAEKFLEEYAAVVHADNRKKILDAVEDTRGQIKKLAHGMADATRELELAVNRTKDAIAAKPIADTIVTDAEAFVASVDPDNLELAYGEVVELKTILAKIKDGIAHVKSLIQAQAVGIHDSANAVETYCGRVRTLLGQTKTGQAKTGQTS